MAEATRRSMVKIFVHRTEYPPYSAPVQSSFLDDAIDNGYEWNCKLVGSIAPQYGELLLVRGGTNAQPEVLWGNQVIAVITDPRGSELMAGLRDSHYCGAVVATIMPGTETGQSFSVRIDRGAR